ncbi:MAG: exopolysaccharide biosynthesis protein [Rickettsiales bacterium]|jgi:hypothetical protein|nr:exopolysaccharide biosynthesis protein [Rickettsiales bacterium]
MRIKRATVFLSNMKEGLVEDKISLQQIFFSSENNSYFTLMMMAVLSLLPTPFVIPLVSNFFGVLMTIISFQIMTNRKTFKIPKRFLNIKIKRVTLINIIEKNSFIFKKIEFLTKHRLIFLFNSNTKVHVINFVNFLMSILVLIPLPFITNPPAFSTIFMILGLLNKDGLFILLGFVMAVLSFLFCVLVCFGGKAIILKYF